MKDILSLPIDRDGQRQKKWSLTHKTSSVFTKIPSLWQKMLMADALSLDRNVFVGQNQNK